MVFTTLAYLLFIVVFHVFAEWFLRLFAVFVFYLCACLVKSGSF